MTNDYSDFREQLINYLETGQISANAEKTKKQVGGFLLPPEYDNYMRWLRYVAPRIKKQINKLLAQGKTAEALGLLQLEPER